MKRKTRLTLSAWLWRATFQEQSSKTGATVTKSVNEKKSGGTKSLPRRLTQTVISRIEPCVSDHPNVKTSKIFVFSHGDKTPLVA